jgi:xanthine/uracil permease
MFLSLLQSGIKILQTFKFVTAAFNFIIVAPYLKFNISTMCHYKIMKQKVSERPIVRVHIFIYIAITLKFI